MTNDSLLFIIRVMNKTKKYQQWIEWYKRNKEQRDKNKKEYDKRYYIKNQEKKKKITKEWYKLNKEKARNYNKQYYLDNKEQIKKRADSWQKENPDRVNKKNRCWAKNNPEKRNFTVNQNKKARRNVKGSHTLQEWKTLKAQYNYTCPCCRKSEPEITLTEDHIIPISKSGTNNIKNIQPLCRKCNSKKHIKIKKYVI